MAQPSSKRGARRPGEGSEEGGVSCHEASDWYTRRVALSLLWPPSRSPRLLPSCESSAAGRAASGPSADGGDLNACLPAVRSLSRSRGSTLRQWGAHLGQPCHVVRRLQLPGEGELHVGRASACSARSAVSRRLLGRPPWEARWRPAIGATVPTASRRQARLGSAVGPNSPIRGSDELPRQPVCGVPAPLNGRPLDGCP